MATQLARQLVRWAKHIDLTRFRKYRRGPKPRKQRPYRPPKHVSAARLLNPQKPPPQKPK
ncbi:MAG: hypothetical protein ACK5Q5_24560 [Planctomycetaceae bacterium]